MTNLVIMLRSFYPGKYISKEILIRTFITDIEA